MAGYCEVGKLKIHQPRLSPEKRRRQLINATIASLSKNGYAATTLSDITVEAGLSTGIVNFHFETKEALFDATLRYLVDEYREHWNAAREQAGEVPAAQLWAVLNCDFDRKVCTKRKLAAWGAFVGEEKTRPSYRALCGSLDAMYEEFFVSLCGRLKLEGTYRFDVRTTALGICAMMTGLWLRLLAVPNFTTQDARDIVKEHLANIFPGHFSRQGMILN
ncbi:MAG: TetR family transcriptional regulator C-terminal domain-containing protein [Rhizobiales bacterium]|nr:TetR family transcriptional regulator C-terminal domain-containing protein [Hyphomicrobiales bacterium]